MAKGVSGARSARRVISHQSGSRVAFGPIGARRKGLAALARAARLPGLGLTSIGLSSLIAAAGAAALSGCGGSNEPVFDPRTMQSIERDSASAEILAPRPLSSQPKSLPTTHNETTSKSGTTLPTTIPSGGLAGTDAPIIRLSLREVVQRAVANNADVRVAGYDPAINAQKVIQAEGAFDPNYVANVNFQRLDTQVNNTPITVGVIPAGGGKETPATAILGYNKQNIYTFETGIQQTMLTGGKVSLTYEVDETDADKPSDFREINPFWENQIKFQVTQPLLKGFGTEVNAAKITIGRDDQKISVLEFRKAMEDAVDQIEQDYWQLYEAEREVYFNQQLVDSSLQTYNVLYERFKVGQVDRDSGGEVPVAQAETRVRANQAVLLASQLHVRDISEDLKRRMNDPTFPVASPIIIMPADTPIETPIEFNLKDQIDTALYNRLELGEQQLRIDETDVLMMTARNGLLPQLDLVADVTVQGLSGDETTAFKNQNEYNHIGYEVGFQLTYPIGNRAPKAALRQAQLQRLQAVEQYRSLVDQVSLDVSLNWDAVYSAYKQAELRYGSRLAAQHQIELLNRQEVTGVAQLTPPFVQVRLQALEDLATAQREEALALANYNIAIEKLEKSKGTLLRYDNVIMEEDPVIAKNNGR